MFLLFEKEKGKLNINIPIWKRTKEKINIWFQAGKKFLSRKAIGKTTPPLKKKTIRSNTKSKLIHNKKLPKMKGKRVGENMYCKLNKIKDYYIF